MIKAGIIGTGVGMKHFEAISGYRKSKVTCILEKDKNKISKIKKKYKNLKIFSKEKDFFSYENLNLVSIASYDEFHYSQIIKSIKKGFNVIVEKPICLNLTQLKNIYYLLKRNPKIKFTSNMVLRKNMLFNTIKKQINLKEIYYIDAGYLWGRKEKLFGWRSKTKNYSLTLGASIHIIDLVCWMLKLKPIKVFTKISNKITKNTKFKKFSFVNYIFTFPNDIIVNIKADGVCAHPHFHTLKIFEKNKTIISEINGQLIIKKNKLNNLKILKTNYPYPDKKNRKKFIQEFLNSILDNKNIKGQTKEIIDVMSVCFYADLSAKKKQELNIKYLND